MKTLKNTGKNLRKNKINPKVLWVILLLLSCSQRTSINLQEKDHYFGVKIFQREATGFFRVEEVDGRLWFITPEGYPFISAGINSVSPYGYYIKGTNYSPYYESILAKYGEEEIWAEAILNRLILWNFNTLGGWSQYELFSKSRDLKIPYTVVLHLSGSSWLEGNIPDYWSDEFVERASRVAQEFCKPLSTDPYLIGYFIDNELRWGIDWRGFKTFFQEYFSMPSTSSGKQKLVEFLKNRYSSISEFNSEWCTNLVSFDELVSLEEIKGCKPETERGHQDRSDFLYLTAKRFFKISREAIKAYDPNHLILGARIVSLAAPPEVVKACGEFSDVLSLNYYTLSGNFEQMLYSTGRALGYPSGFLSTKDNFYKFYETANKPILISEFGFRAADSGLPNTKPPIFKVYRDQFERAKAYKKFVKGIISQPYVVGFHWFAWVDEPGEGRFDGEDSNWGVVNKNDEPYEVLVNKMEEVNSKTYCLHLGKCND